MVVSQAGGTFDRGADSEVDEVLRYNLKTVRAYLLKRIFRRSGTMESPYWAGRYLDRWCARTLRSRIEPMKSVAKMLRSPSGVNLEWFRAKSSFSSGVVEGFLNGKAD